ncbi:hypothetical protein DYBT9275_04411 [Dyadobacter sp. CECT 9275]|uniref:Gliding motility protein n=1 Tax=Dyadobacter helix TaxID=2822344 RepID=A0A916JGG6_9BACT|nr:gliding motility protein [Dyadobacter sp. CECT 9275]CAG5009046.1 hypothetical protein DYBT9275_04411 [Dyadobacter sp. CECT 9275]
MFDKIKYLFWMGVAGILLSCGDSQKGQADFSATKVALSADNLDEELFRAGSVKDVENFLDNHSYLRAGYFTDFQGDSTQLAAHLFEVLGNKDFRSFKSEVDSIIGDKKTVILDPLAAAFERIRENYPSFRSPKIKFIMTGFTGNDLYITDSLIVIGLDYFGGAAARFRPNVFDYQLRRYQKESIVPAILFYMSGKYNKLNPADHTLLADMIGYGKSFEFVKQVLPECPDSLVLGYSEENLQRTYNSQKDIWAYFITNKLLYEKNDLKKQKYIGERPFTVEIGNEVPGGIGRWLGWRIVNKFATEHPELSLPELMNIDNAGYLFQESGYKGEKDEDE